MNANLAIAAMVAILFAAACGDAEAPSATTRPDAISTTTTATTPVLSGDEPVLDWEETGGCFMMGPNCRRFVLRADGSFDLFRAGDAAGDPVMTGSIDTSLATAIAAAVSGTDLAALRAQLGPGECRACFDGVDYLAVFPTAGADAEFSSADVEFDFTHPVFAAAAAAVVEMEAGSELPIVSR